MTAESLPRRPGQPAAARDAGRAREGARAPGRARAGAAEFGPDEIALLRLLAQGLPLCSVARRLRTSERTVRRRTRDICDRLGVGTSIQAVVWAAQQGLL